MASRHQESPAGVESTGSQGAMALQGSGAGRQTKPRPGTLTLQFTDADGAHWTLKATTPKKAQFASCDQCKQWLRSPYWGPATLAAMHQRGTGHKADLWVIAKVTPPAHLDGEDGGG